MKKLKEHDPPKGETAAVRHPNGGIVVLHWWNEMVCRYAIGDGILNAAPSPDIEADWQPLLTESEWRARHPLALRKLEEGEGVKSERWYLSVAKDRDPELHYSGCLRALNGMRYEVHELPPLPPAESEPTPFEEGKAILRELVDSAVEAHGEQILEGVDPAVQRVLGEPAPAPNSVGERLPINKGFIRVCELLDAFDEVERLRIIRAVALIMLPPSPELAALFAGEVKHG